MNAVYDYQYLSMFMRRISMLIKRTFGSKMMFGFLTLCLILGNLSCTANTPTPAVVPTQAPVATQAPAATQATEATPTTEASSSGIAPAPQAILDYTTKVTPGDKDYGGATVTVMVDAIQTGQPFNWYADAIKKQFNINLKVIAVPFDALYSNIQNDLISNAGAYDIFVYPPRFTGDLASAGNLVVLDDFAKKWDPQLDDVIPVYRELYEKYNGSIVALTFDGDRLELYYRKDLMENADEKAAFQAKFGYPLAAPETWKQYVDVASFFTRKAGEKLAGETLTAPFYGMAEITRAPDNFGWWINRFASCGGVYFDDQMHPQVATPCGISAMDNFKESIKYGAPDILNYGYDASFNALIQGKTAMVIQWTDIARAAEDPSTSTVVGKVGYAEVPGTEINGTVVHRPVLDYGRVMAISKLSKNAEAAYRVIQFMHSPEVSINYVTEPASGIDPFRLSSFKEPSKWVMQWPTLNDYIANSEKSLKDGYPEISIPGAARYDESLIRHVATALAGQETSQAALDAVTKEWEAITDELGRDQQIIAWQAQLALWKTVGLVK
jgi:multiple sugar transport system substrate-binding protein